MTEQIKEAEQALLHTYNRYPVVLERGEGVYLYDTTGKKYLEFGAGFAVNAVGYGGKRYAEALKNQIDTLMHTSNYFYHPPLIQAANRLVKAAGLSKVFFTNSGTEAVEGALKAAKKYAYNKDGETDHEIIAFSHAFHGRSLGALSVTGTQAYRTPFAPFFGTVHFAEYNDFESVRALVTKKTCAIIVEPIQGEGGVIPATASFLQQLRKLCDDNDIVLIFDEIQCGVGRTGRMFAYEHAKVLPDILTVAKGIGAGFPVGAFLLNEKVAAASLVAGDHGSTYGGNPLAMTAVNTVLDILQEDDVISHVQQVGAYLENRLEELQARFPDKIKLHRGMGLMQGLQFIVPAGEVITKALDKGLILMGASDNVIRFVPPLVIREEHVDEMVTILTACLTE